MTTIQQNYTCLLETGNERLFKIGRHAASAVSGTLTYVIRDENTGAIVFHVSVAGEHRKAVLSALEVKIVIDSEAVNKIVGQVNDG